MISGTKDAVVSSTVMDQLYRYYLNLLRFIPASNIVYKKDLVAAHTFIILFPQTHSDDVLHLTTSNLWVSNANGCWDWIGWYGSDFATKNGLQMSFIKKMIDRIVGNK